jgi:hypothetical protein
MPRTCTARENFFWDPGQIENQVDAFLFAIGIVKFNVVGGHAHATASTADLRLRRPKTPRPAPGEDSSARPCLLRGVISSTLKLVSEIGLFSE